MADPKLRDVRVVIGDHGGKIAVVLDERGAFDLLNCFRSDDGFARDLGAAIAEAYPEEEQSRG
jgi:hypothetical protein